MSAKRQVQLKMLIQNSFRNAYIKGKLRFVQAASPLIAVFQFFLRDLAGMCGGVLFAFAQVLLKHLVVNLHHSSVSCRDASAETDSGLVLL